MSETKSVVLVRVHRGAALCVRSLFAQHATTTIMMIMTQSTFPPCTNLPPACRTLTILHGGKVEKKKRNGSLLICGLSAKIDSEMAEWWPELENGQYNADIG